MNRSLGIEFEDAQGVGAYTVEVLIIRKGFGGTSYYMYDEEPSKIVVAII